MCRSLVVFSVVILLGAAPLHALTDEEIFRDLRLNLINPGARSLALGGAFVSLADDATAAQANPAGLGFLLKQEYFIELRSVDHAAQSSLRTEELPAGIDTFVATGTDQDDVVSPTFASVVTTYGRWSMGLSYQELLNVSNSTLSTFAFTFEGTPGVFLTEGTGSLDLDVANINVSVGGKITDRLGIGGTLTYSRLDLQSEVVNLIVDTAGNVADEEILQPTLDLRTSIDDDDDDVVGSLGIIYKSKRPDKWSLGAVYRAGADFTVIERIDPEQEVDGRIEGIDLFGVRDRLGGAFVNRLHLPDVFGIGGSWRGIEDRLTLALNVERIHYSNLLDGYESGVNVLTSETAEFDIDDATDYRLGAEYLLFNDNNPLPPLALRAGAFRESSSTIEALSTGTDESPGFATEAVFQGRDDEYHGTIGVGINLSRYKIDIAADFAESKNEYVISFIYQGK